MHKRSLETMAGALELERPYFYCTRCSLGIYPLDEALGLSPAIKQDDIQSVGVFLATEVSYEVASETYRRCTGQEFSEHGLHKSVNRVAEGLGILDVCPSKEEVDEKIARIGEGKRWRPVMMMTLDGAQETVRPEPSPRKGMRGKGDWKEVKAFRLYLIDEDRIEHVIEAQIAIEGLERQQLRALRELTLNRGSQADARKRLEEIDDQITALRAQLTP